MRPVTEAAPLGFLTGDPARVPGRDQAEGLELLGYEFTPRLGTSCQGSSEARDLSANSFHSRVADLPAWQRTALQSTRRGS